MTQRRRAMSVIELFILLLAFALLLALMLPALAKVRAQARSTQCVNNLRQLGVALFEYCAQPDSRLRFPPQAGDREDRKYWLQADWQAEWKSEKSLPKSGMLWQYYNNESVVLCPMEQGNGVFSYSMAKIEKITSALFPATAVLALHESGPQNIGAKSREGTFRDTDKPDTDCHDGRTPTLWVDGHVAMYDWADYEGTKANPRKTGTVPTAAEIEIDGVGFLVTPKPKAPAK